MADSEASYRLTTPAHQAYDTSPGEQMVLRGLDPNNLGALYGVLMNQRALGGASQQQYGRDLRMVNQQQGVLAAAHMANQNQDSERKAILGLVQHGNLPSSVAMSGMNLSGLPGFLNRGDAAQGTLGADDRRALLDLSKAQEQSGSGLYSAAQAGVLPSAGQTVAPGAAGNVALRREVGTPLGITIAGINAAAHPGAGGRAVYGSSIPMAGGDPTYTVRSGDPDTTVQASERMMQLHRAAEEARTRAAGGNLSPGAAGTSPPGGRPALPPTPAPRLNPPPPRTATPSPTAAPTANARPAVGAQLSQGERAAIARLEATHGPAQTYIRSGDGTLRVRTARGTFEVR